MPEKLTIPELHSKIIEEVREKYGIDITEDDIVSVITKYLKYMKLAMINKMIIIVPYLGKWIYSVDRVERYIEKKQLLAAGWSKDDIRYKFKKDWYTQVAARRALRKLKGLKREHKKKLLELEVLNDERTRTTNDSHGSGNGAKHEGLKSVRFVVQRTTENSEKGMVTTTNDGN